jgi:uracil-DNA glycosylase family 4
MEPKMPSEAWELLTDRQKQEMYWLTARMMRDRLDGAQPRDHLRTLAQEVLKPGSRVLTQHAATGSTVPRVTAAPWSARTTPADAQSTEFQLVVNLMPRADKLERLYRKLQGDAEFKHLSNVSNFVPGDGRWPDPAAMLIGEAPGAHEDRLQRPFCGRSGNMLDGMLWDAGLKRPDCFVTNVVKWRPPGNRTPTRVEIEYAIPYLRKEVVTVLPDGGLVILLGSVPLSVVDPDLRVSKVHGESFIRGKWTFVPMYHPAYIIRQSSTVTRDEYKADWLKVKELRAA